MKILKVSIIIIGLLTVYGSFLNNESSEIQVTLYEDFNTGKYTEQSTIRFKNFNMDYPNLTLTSLPIRGVVAKYYLLGGEYNNALELLNQSENVNPYIMYSESVKTEIFDALKIQDSSLYYAEKAFTGIPKNQKHFIDLAKSYVGYNKHEKLDSMFKIVRYSEVPDIWKFYLSSLLADESKITSYGKEMAKLSIDKFLDSEHPQIHLAAQYVLVGTEQVTQATEIDRLAESKYNNQEYFESGKLWEKAGKLNPLDFSYFENAGLSFYNSKNYDEAIPNFRFVIDSINPKSGKSEYLLALTYHELGENKKACNYIKKSSQQDFVRAFQLIPIYCE
tara:strand:+ start:16 stop:1017 length:1002 start_codon:yes stop_codon:yes gene_type:complete